MDIKIEEESLAQGEPHTRAGVFLTVFGALLIISGFVISVVIHEGFPCVGGLIFGSFLAIVGLTRIFGGIAVGWMAIAVLVVALGVLGWIGGSTRKSIGDDFAAQIVICVCAISYFAIPISAFVAGCRKGRPIAGFFAMLFSPIGFILIACIPPRDLEEPLLPICPEEGSAHTPTTIPKQSWGKNHPTTNS